MSATAGMVGADIAALESAARELSVAADELDRSAHSLTSSLGSLEWLGAVALRFSDAWNSQHNAGMAKTAAFLHDNASLLFRQAAQQREASAAGGGSDGMSTGIGRGDVPKIPRSATPQQVAEWWQGLTDEQRRAILASSPGVIGNLNGVPFEVRYEANRAYMQEVLDAEASPDGPMHRLLRQFTDPSGRIIGPPTADKCSLITHQIILFDPSGDGKIAEVFGDMSVAENVVVVVPGLGSTVANFGSIQGDARALQAAAGRDTAVIAWTGYDAPNLSEVGTDAMAKAGAAEFSSFVAAIREESTGNVIALGHSYGSLVVGEALKSGLQVETVIFIGSAGVGVDSVAEFPSGAADHYFAAEIPGDFVANFQHFGESPTDPDFGAQVFDAGHEGGTFTHHSHYIKPGQGMDNIVQIVHGGEPSTVSAAPIDYVIEPLEDVSQAIDRTVDWVQARVDLPYVDNAVDSAVDGAQTRLEKMSNALETAVEFVDDTATNTASAAGTWVADKAQKVGDALTFWN